MNGAIPLGAEAVRALDLIEIQRRLDAAEAAKVSARSMSVECRSLADEARAEVRHMDASSYAAAAIRWLSRVMVVESEIRGLLAEQRKLTTDAGAASTVLSAEQVAAVDDTLCGVPA